jgi:dihydroflavonol-4-reductase
MYLVTGATGHIGNVLVRGLLERGQAVRALVRPGRDLFPLKGLDVALVQGDVLEPDSLRAAMTGVEGVFHLAGVISILPGEHPTLRRVNAEGTANVLQAARKTGLRRVVYASSIHAYQAPPPGTIIDESLPFDPVHNLGAYDRSKAEGSLAAQQAAQAGQDVVLACPTGVVGPFDFRRSDIGNVVRASVRGWPGGYIKGGAYDFVDVRDVAGGLMAAMEHGRAGESYLLSGERMMVKEMLELVRAASGNRAPLIGLSRRQAELVAQLLPPLYRVFGGARPAITPYSVAVLFSASDISHAKATRELGYQPRPVRESLRDAVRWFQEDRGWRSAVEKAAGGLDTLPAKAPLPAAAVGRGHSEVGSEEPAD